MNPASRRDLLRLFVYGTLKHGERNHDRYCRGASFAGAATVRGRLYDLPLGFPALVVPREDVHGVGTEDYLADAKLPLDTAVPPPEVLEGYDVVHGELLLFEDAERILPEIDGLEGFRPGGESFYTRVLIPVTSVLEGETILAWAYSVAQVSGTRLPGGIWPSPGTGPG